MPPPPTIIAMQQYVAFPTAFGTCALAWNESGLTRFHLPDARATPNAERTSSAAADPAARTDAPSWIQELIARVRRHFEGHLQDFSDIQLDWSQVSGFQQCVYRQTLGIKPGYKKSYGEIARLMSLGNDAARAVGVALGNNPWPLIVPCHRVVSASDKMTGFSGPGGVLTKTRLLALEGAELISE